MGEVVERIKERILKEGKITFAEFMEMALYLPELGYYTSARERVGAQGDFYTSPATHPVFGALISIQLEQMWDLLGQPNVFSVVEMGAGKGLLAQDILNYLPYLTPEFAHSVEYVALERGNASILRAPQTGRALESFKHRPQQLLAALGGVTGCFLSNELLDAFPTHRVVIQGRRLREIYVTLRKDSFVEVADDPSTPLLEQRLAEEGVALTEGYSTEINLNIWPWIKDIAGNLKKGFVFIIDYGHVANELYSSQRKLGTLMTYYKHTCGDNPYLRIGEQDITSHVDFTSVVMSGQKVGLQAFGPTSQRHFLLNLGFWAFVEAMAEKGLEYHEYLANRFSMLELIRPEGMGAFGVLIQGKGLDAVPLYGLTPNNEKAMELRAMKRELKVPALRQEHIPLLSAKYSHYSPAGMTNPMWTKLDENYIE